VGEFCSVEEGGLWHLHRACHFRRSGAVITSTAPA